MALLVHPHVRYLIAALEGAFMAPAGVSGACANPQHHAARCRCGFGGEPVPRDPRRCHDEAHHAPDCECALLFDERS